MENYYVRNMGTGKLEMHFEKDFYMSLPDDQKKEIKRNYLFSRKVGGWVSRAKFPNLYYAEQVAQKLGLDNAGKEGERLTFKEQQELKAQRAFDRAERMEYKAEKAEKHGKDLQKPINDMHGDIAFFTQPNINSAAGRAFTRKRDRMFDAWERGFEEFRKSAYYSDCAKAARETAANTKPKDKGFCQRRIEDANKVIRAQKKNLRHYQSYIDQINEGVEIKHINGSIINREEIESWIEKYGGNNSE